MNNYFITFNKDEIIFLEGQSSNCAYIIESGKVGIYREDSSGNRFLVRKLSKKDLFGEMSLIDKYPRSATAIALEIINGKTENHNNQFEQGKALEKRQFAN